MEDMLGLELQAAYIVGTDSNGVLRKDVCRAAELQSGRLPKAEDHCTVLLFVEIRLKSKTRALSVPRGWQTLLEHGVLNPC